MNRPKVISPKAFLQHVEGKCQSIWRSHQKQDNLTNDQMKANATTILSLIRVFCGSI